MRRIIAVLICSILAFFGLFGCSKNSTRDMEMLDLKRVKGVSLKDNNIDKFSVAYVDEKGNYNADKKFSFTEKNGIEFRRALVKNGYFYVNTSIVGGDSSCADATVKFHKVVFGDEFYDKVLQGKDSIEKIDDTTFYECNNDSKAYTTYYAYKLIKNKNLEKGSPVVSDYEKQAKYIVVEIKMYIYNDDKTTTYINYTEEDYKAEILKVADCITEDNDSPYICDLGCIMAFNGVSCKNYNLIKEVSREYILVKYNDLVSLRVSEKKSDLPENNDADEEYIEDVTEEKSDSENKVLGLSAIIDDESIKIAFDEDVFTVFDIYNLSAEETIDIDKVVTFINENMKYVSK